MWSQLQPQVSLYGFDPDAEECARIQTLYPHQDVCLVPQALADKPGRRTLYLTRDPACSSLYPPDSALIASVPVLECAAPTGETEIEVSSLDRWGSETGIQVIDFLKLDTQGSELDILRGAEGLLASTRMLEIEVEFNPIYKGIPLFGDIDRFLRERGFVLWKLSHAVHHSYGEIRRDPQPEDSSFFDNQVVRSRTYGGQLFWGHAHYLRSEIAVAAPAADWHQSVRDAALAQVLGFHDLRRALLCTAIAHGAPAHLGN
jgi:FkbM family methyltransferase